MSANVSGQQWAALLRKLNVNFVNAVLFGLTSPKGACLGEG